MLRGVDMVVIRELTGGLYYGRPSEIRESPDGASAVDTMAYTEAEIERIVRFAFTLARGRRKRVTSVDKANVLSCSRLWRRIATRVGAGVSPMLSCATCWWIPARWRSFASQPSSTSS